MQHKNFLIKRTIEISEIQTTLIELEHIPTGAQIIKLANEDEENLFNLSFKTWPETSNGVAHILEHVVLCGSEHFPVRDPFFSMNRRSLNTFMNALTGADFTCYPAATQVEKDFYNLLEVYLDAVFKPKLTKLSFRQEGHRLEFMSRDDPNSPLLFKGIVFNEMKGALATGEARLTEALMSALFPDLTYGINSGGDPKIIPTLTYEQLKAFHAQFYHPSRCLYFFYGNLPLEQQLNFIEEHALAGAEKLPPLPNLPKQPRFEKEIAASASYPISEDDDPTEKVLLGFSWLTCCILEQVEVLALNVLDIILMGTDASPLKMALLRSNLCIQADSMLDDEMSEIPFTLICKGCREESPDKIERVIHNTLSELIKKGIPSHLIDGAIHQLELQRTEITGNSSPYGLNLFFRSALLKQHGGLPEDGLRIHTLFSQLREKVKDPCYLTGLIEKHLLHNPHRVRITMLPEKQLVAQEVEEEQQQLIAICGQLKDPDVKEILDEAKALAEAQEESVSENLDILPKVTLSDVAPEGKEFPLNKALSGSLTLYHHPCFTNGIIYADCIFDLPHIEEEDLPLLRLFSVLLPQLGCGGRNYRENLEYLVEHTGGVGVSLDLGIQADDPKQMKPSLVIRGKALYRKMDRLFPLFKDFLESTDFRDTARLKELLDQHLLGLENSIHHNALRYAVNLAARGLSVASTINSTWYGLDYYDALKRIVEAFDQNPHDFIAKMESLQALCLGLKGADLVLSCDQEAFERLKNARFYGFDALQESAFSPWQGNYPIQATESQGRMITAPVAFTTLLFESVPYTHPYSPALSIASEIMENKTLHRRIREQGGAYGSGAVSGALSGQFYFYTYRDPQIKSSVDAFKEAVETLIKGEFEQSDIEEAKLGLFQNLDAPTPPGARAITAYARLRGKRTPEIRQLFRERLHQVTREEIIQAAKELLEPGLEKGTLVAFAGKDLLRKETALLKPKISIFTV